MLLKLILPASFYVFSMAKRKFKVRGVVGSTFLWDSALLFYEEVEVVALNMLQGAPSYSVTCGAPSTFCLHTIGGPPVAVSHHLKLRKECVRAPLGEPHTGTLEVGGHGMVPTCGLKK